ncbi:hypothetical protein ACFVGY_00630 [Streptomyces sp. NPDC127106]|uniref:hypothetical protein n=1 Tax=Streptomyces sp. NPDC127106 TaxID=3345360 RepID=UPI00363AD046
MPALREALRLAPGALPVLQELVAAFEAEDRHTEAAETLLRHEDLLEPWPGSYLLAYNSLLAGDLATARDRTARLPEPADSDWDWAHGRLRRMLRRAEAAAGATPLDRTDLRGWQFALTGTLLGTLSPYGFDVMAGRYGYLADTHSGCHRGLDRLAIALDAAGRRPTAVSALPGRSDRIVALAAAELLGLPVEPYAPGRPDTLVVAYDLSAHEPEVLDGLRERTPGQVLYEHAASPPAPVRLGAVGRAAPRRRPRAGRHPARGGHRPGHRDRRPVGRPGRRRGAGRRGHGLPGVRRRRRPALAGRSPDTGRLHGAGVQRSVLIPRGCSPGSDPSGQGAT